MNNNIKMIIFSITLLFVGFSFLSNAYNDKIPSDLEVIIEGINAGNMLITSMKGSWVYEYIVYDYDYMKKQIKENYKNTNYYPDMVDIPTNEIFKINFLMKGKKKRIDVYDVLHLESEPYEKISYNGEKSDIIRLFGLENKEKVLIKAYGIVESEENHHFKRFFPIGIFPGLALDNYIENGRFKNNFISKGPIVNESIDGIQCKVITFAFEDTEYIYWIAPDIDYKTVMMKLIKPKESMTITTYKYRQYGNIWFPFFIEQTHFFIQSNGDKKPIYQHRYTMNDDLIINSYVDDHMFEIEFPKGLTISDNRTGEIFEVK